MKTIYNKTYLSKPFIKSAVLDWFKEFSEDRYFHKLTPGCDITIKGFQSRYMLVGVQQNPQVCEKRIKILLFNLSLNKLQSFTVDQFKSKATSVTTVV